MVPHLQQLYITAAVACGNKIEDLLSSQAIKRFAQPASDAGTASAK